MIDEIVSVDQVGWLLELQKYDGYVGPTFKFPNLEKI
jgi:hypothetical protein